MDELYELLKSIEVTNWYLGRITAFSALNNCATMNKNDQNKVRRATAKLGYKCSFKRGYIDWIYKP